MKEDDAISRQAALKIIDGWYDNNRDTENIEDLIILITYMASVNPQPKTGHWQKRTDASGNSWHACPACGHIAHTLTRFCPDCGARLEAPS